MVPTAAPVPAVAQAMAFHAADHTAPFWMPREARTHARGPRQGESELTRLYCGQSSFHGPVAMIGEAAMVQYLIPTQCASQSE